METQALLAAFLSFSVYTFASVPRYVARGKSGVPELNKERFVASIRDNSMRRFIASFVHSQMFTSFVEKQVVEETGANPFEAAATFTAPPDAPPPLPTRPAGAGGASPSLSGGGASPSPGGGPEDADTLYGGLAASVRGDMEFTDVLKSVRAAMPATCAAASEEVREIALEMTSNSSTKRPRFETFKKLAIRTYDAVMCARILDVVWVRLDDSAGRNWRHGHKALQLLQFLLSAGSEMVVAGALKHISKIYALTRFKSGALGVSNAHIRRVRTVAHKTFAVLAYVSRRTSSFALHSPRFLWGLPVP